jgi:hypothetical protein
MVDQKFFSFTGKFICKKCKENVTDARFWNETGDVTWMCSKKHISKVELDAKKKKKKDFSDE